MADTSAATPVAPPKKASPKTDAAAPPKKATTAQGIRFDSSRRGCYYDEKTDETVCTNETMKETWKKRGILNLKRFVFKKDPSTDVEGAISIRSRATREYCDGSFSCLNNNIPRTQGTFLFQKAAVQGADNRVFFRLQWKPVKSTPVDCGVGEDGQLTCGDGAGAQPFFVEGQRQPRR